MIVIDIETTGTDPQKHSILSIGAINSHDISKRFYEECRIWDGARIDRDALVINGFSPDDAERESKQSEAELIHGFLSWIELQDEITPAALNPLFDLGFLQTAAKRAGENYILPHRSIDLHSVAYAHMTNRGITPPVLNKKTDLNSDKIMEYVGIPKEPHPHKALNGAIWELEAFSRLLYGKGILTDFEKYPILWKTE